MSSINIARKALREAKEVLGGYAEIARLCEVSRQAVNSWYENGVPVIRAMQIEKFTESKLKGMDISSIPQEKRHVMVNLEAWSDGKVLQSKLYPEIRVRKSNKKRES